MNQRSRAPRHPRADGERTRAAILRMAASLATVDGLEGLSIGNLAAAIGMSKSGLYAHFGTKQELQLATVDEAERILTEEVVQPALAAPPGLAQLAAVCEAYISYVERRASSPAAASSPPRRWQMGAPSPGRSRTGSPPSPPVSPRCSPPSRPPRSSSTSFPPCEDPGRALRLRAARDPAGRRHQIRPARRPGSPGPGPPGRPPAARTRQRQQRRRQAVRRGLALRSPPADEPRTEGNPSRPVRAAVTDPDGGQAGDVTTRPVSDR